MPRSALSVLSAVTLAATVCVAPALATTQTDSATTQGAESTTAVDVQRLAGADRYGTAAEVSDQWSKIGKRVYIVSGHNFPDAIVAASRAGVFNAPMLLTKSDNLPNDTVEALQRLEPDRIVVVGGQGAVSEAVISELGQYAGPEGVERVADEGRYGTSARIAAQYTKDRDRVFVAGGADYPDALAAAAIAGAQREPLLLTRPGALPSEIAKQLERLSPDEVVVVGGPHAVSDAVAARAASYSVSGKYRRVSGADRYKTAAAVAQEFSTGAKSGYVASGIEYADALVVSALAARDDLPVVLTPANHLAEGTVQALNHLDPDRVFVVGGPAAVSEAVVKALANPGTPNPPEKPKPPTPPAPKPPTGTSAGVWNGMGASDDGEFVDLVGGGLDLGHGSSYYTSGQFGPNWPDARDRDRLASGMTLQLGMASKNYKKGGPTSRMAWPDIAAGKHDSEIRAWGQALGQLEGDIRFSFDIEPDAKFKQGRVPDNWTTADYKGALRRISTILGEEAPGVQFTFWVAGYQKDIVAEMYPGDKYVDVICWDSYVNRHVSPDISPLELWSDFKFWLDDQSWGKGKTLGLCETGFHNGHSDPKGAAFWEQAPGAADELGLSFITYFHDNSGPLGNYTMENMPLTRNAYAEAMVTMDD